MSLRSWIFAATYDRKMRRVDGAGLGPRRDRLVGQARGDVLEIGAGTGTNHERYGPAVTSLTVIEPERAMLRRLERRAGRPGRPLRVLRAPAERLPFSDASFDTVVSTLVLCAVDDQPQALREIRRVLVPGGQLLFLEHVPVGDPSVAPNRHGARRSPRRAGGHDGHHPTLDAIRGAGFSVTEVATTELPMAPTNVRPAVVGVARAPAAERQSPEARQRPFGSAGPSGASAGDEGPD